MVHNGSIIWGYNYWLKHEVANGFE
jgi:hypothetical protein